MKRLHTCLNIVTIRSLRFAVAAVLVSTGIACATSNGVAYAAGTQHCINNAQCLNAWGGGPAVNVFSSNVANDNFVTVFAADSRYLNIQFQGSGIYHNYCIGDMGNDPNSARAGLVTGCGTSSIGWGGNFAPSDCDDGHGHAGTAFKNVHWGGWLGPQNPAGGNGTAFYLNKPTSYCFVESAM